MPRSSRHKSSKHSSRDARDYSDSEKDSSLKERKGKEESSSRVSKDSDKRKLDSKDSHPVEYVSSKRRKERAVEDGVSDRWNGGEEDRGGEVSRKSKSSSDSKSKRKEESEGKHKDASRKDRESDRERKGKEGKSEKLLASEEEPNIKQLREITESNTVQAEPDSQVERRIRRKKDDSGDGDKHLDDVGDAKDRRFTSKDDISKDGKLKDDKRKDERYRDKYREDPNGDSKYQDERPTKDHTSSKSDEKYLRDDKDMTENRQKKSKSQDRDREHKTVRDRDQVRDRYHDHERESERDRERGRDRNHNRDRDYYRDHDWDKDRDRERGRERNWDRDRETDRERERDYDHDDRSGRYKDSRGREKSPDDRDDYNDSKPRVTKGHLSDMEKKPLSSSRVEFEADRGRSQSRQVPVDSSSKRRRISPSSGSHVGTDENRYFKSEESKYRDSVTEQRSKVISSRGVTDPSRVPERSSKYRPTDKSNDMDDGHLGELSVERSSSSKASPMGLVERSPSSTSVEHRQMNRSGLRRGHDAEEPGRRSGGSFEDRLNRDTPLEKPTGDDPSQADSSFYNRTGQGNSSIPPLPGFRAGADSPSYMEDENKYSSNARYKRSGDPNMARGHGNAWRGAPNWSSPMPNGFMPFQHGPPLGGFQSMMPQFPSPPLFGVRPSMEINHGGIPYHIPGADRFSGHLRPLGWQNMMDGSVPSHLHGWDGGNGVYRDEPHMYGGPDWDQNRHPMNRRNWETSTETWKGQNGDVNKDPLSSSQKEDYPVHGMDDEFSADGQVGQKSQQKQNRAGIHAKDVETSPGIKISQSQPKVVKEKMPDSSEKSSYDDAAQLSCAYLSKLDVSRDLANQELYIQCMRLLDLEDEEATVAEDITMRVNLLGGKSNPKTSLAFHGSSPFLTSKDAVFQRAMDLYKKQRVDSRGVPIVTRAVLDEVTATDPEIKDDHIPNQNEGNEDEQMLTSNVEPTSDKLIAEVAPDQNEGKEELTDALVSASDQEMAEVVPIPAIKEPKPEPEPEEPLTIPSFENKNAVKSEAGDMDSSPARDVKVNGEVSGDGVNGNLSCSDGSVTVKTESNDDSESVVISRIH